MTPAEVAQALEEWATETIDGLNGSYDYAPGENTQALPAVAVELTSVSQERTAPPEFPLEQVEQQELWIYAADLVFAVDPTDESGASQTLYGFIADLQEALRDETLGGRFASITQRPSFELPPFHIEFEDSTEVRPMTLKLAVADRVTT